MYNGFVISDHFPLCVSSELSCACVECNNVASNNPKISWDRLFCVELSKHKLLTDDNLGEITLCYYVIMQSEMITVTSILLTICIMILRMLLLYLIRMLSKIV